MSNYEQEKPSLANRVVPKSELTKEIQGAAQRELDAAEPDAPIVAAEERIFGLEQKIQDLIEARDRHEIRKPYIDKLFYLTVVWLAIVIIFLVLQATAKNFFSLPDSVLIAFITSSTVSVLGLFVLAARWLFPTSSKDTKE